MNSFTLMIFVMLVWNTCKIRSIGERMEIDQRILIDDIHRLRDEVIRMRREMN